MAEFPSLPLFTDAYLADTRHLSTLEHGAYLLLLICMWRSKAELRNNDKFLAKITGLSTAQWRRVKPIVFDFFVVSDQTITQKRLTDEYAFVRQKRSSQQNNARARWLKTNNTGDAMAMPRECHGNAPTPTPTPIEKKEPIGSQKKPPKRATQIPNNWTPSDSNILYAQDKKLTDEEIKNEADKFRDYHLARGTTFKNWDAGWRTWVANSIKFASNRHMAGSSQTGRFGQNSSFASVVAQRRIDGKV